MRFDVVTLFPELFPSHLQTGVTERAFASGQVDVRLWPLRDFAMGNYRRVDDRPYGGGPGMVLMAPPLLRAVDAVLADRGDEQATVILFSPIGERLTQRRVFEVASGKGAVLICGRYEGIDQRFIDARVQLQLSLGDFVLSGGEIPALCLLDAVARLQPGVLSPGSAELESFSDGLLEGPCWTRPESLEVDGDVQRVPEVLLQGHHMRQAIERRQASLRVTLRQRPDLIDQARQAGRLSGADEEFLKSLGL